MSLITCFNLVSPELIKQLDYVIIVGPFKLKFLCSTLLCSTLFCIRFTIKISFITYMPKPALEMAWAHEEYEMFFQIEMPLKMGMIKARQTFSEYLLLSSTGCKASVL